MKFQFLFVLKAPWRPFGNQELELEGRSGWNFSSCSRSRFLSDRSGTRNWNWRAEFQHVTDVS